jgi:tetratricopeptide (TPR) repeat protein
VIRTIFNLFLGFVFILFVSCSDSKQLQEAEILLEINPSAADSILTSMPTPTSGRKRALYAILKTQADYKRRLTIASDSLITIATDYYGSSIRGSKNRKYHSALAWYSLGCVYSELNDNLAAIEAFLKAKDLFPDTLVRYYALTEQNLGNHYLNRMMLEPAKQQLESCKINAERLQDTIMHNYVFLRIGLSALYSSDFVYADSIFSEIVNNPSFSYAHKTAAMLQMAKIYLFFKKDFQKALEYVNCYIDMQNNKNKSGAGYNIKAEIFYEMQKYDSAFYYYTESMEHSTELYTRCSTADRLTELSLLFDSNTKSIYWHKLYGELRDSINTVERAKEIEELQHYHREAMTQEHFAHKQRLMIVLTLFSIFVISLILFLIYSFYKNREKKRIMEKQQELINIEEEIRKSSIKVLESKISKLSVNDPNARKTLLNLYASRLTMCNNIFNRSDEFRLLSSVKFNLKELNKDEKKVLFERLKNSYLESISDFLKEVPDVKENEILTILLKYQDLSIEQISELFSITTDVVKKRLSRLSQRTPADFLNIYTTRLSD